MFRSKIKIQHKANINQGPKYTFGREALFCITVDYKYAVKTKVKLLKVPSTVKIVILLG